MTTLTAMSAPPPTSAGPTSVPLRTIAATIAMVVAAYVAWQIFQEIAHVLQLIAIAFFFALVLNPAVDVFERKLKISRGLASAITFILGLAVLSALLYVFIRPLAEQIRIFIDTVPQYVADAQAGEGPAGDLIVRYNVDEYLRDNQDRLRDSLTESIGPAASIVSGVFSTVATLLTVLVLSFLMLLSGRNMLRAPLIFFEPATQERIRKVAADCAKAVSGYVAGNLVISIIAGVTTFVALRAVGVPYAAVLALWVAFADLIPLVGATLGAIPTVGIAFLSSIRSGVIVLVFYIVYQQIENHLLQPAVMSKTVHLNPLVILSSVLIGVDLAGVLGALIAIPVAGVIQVIGRDLFDHRTHRLKGEPTVGVDEVAISEAGTEKPSDQPS